VGSCEHGNEQSDSIKDEEFIDQELILAFQEELFSVR
jgi:hypothetical protein